MISKCLVSCNCTDFVTLLNKAFETMYKKSNLSPKNCRFVHICKKKTFLRLIVNITLSEKGNLRS